jgi:glycosyltransferase involved in cell wall biosynthesis
MANVLLEAASTGRPVLASNIPGCMETFDEGISGFGFEVRNIDSLVETIIKFIELPYEQKKAMGIAGRKKMEKEFDRSLVIEAYLEEISLTGGRK